MKKFLKMKVWPVLAGLLVAFIIMMAFEYVNSFFYPLPESLDPSDTSAVQLFTASLPWTAYILVFLGWVTGSFIAGCVTTYLSGEKQYSLSFVVGVILTIMGVLNNLVIGHAMLFNIIAIPMFIVFTYAGHTYLLSMNKRKGR